MISRSYGQGCVQKRWKGKNRRSCSRFWNLDLSGWQLHNLRPTKLSENEKGLDIRSLLNAYSIRTWCHSREWAQTMPAGYLIQKPNIPVQAVGNGLPNGPKWPSSFEITVDNIAFITKLVWSKALDCGWYCKQFYKQELLLMYFSVFFKEESGWEHLV